MNGRHSRAEALAFSVELYSIVTSLTMVRRIAQCNSARLVALALSAARRSC